MRTTILSLVLALLGACGSAPKKARPGSVGGDIYVMMESGDVKKNAGASVLLVRPSDSLVAALSAVCEDYKSRSSDGLKRAKALGFGRATALYDSLEALGVASAGAFVSRLAAAAAAETKATMEAHYAFHDVAPGQYLLFTERLARWNAERGPGSPSSFYGVVATTERARGNVVYRWNAEPSTEISPHMCEKRL